jgi:hypothetical protein
LERFDKGWLLEWGWRRIPCWCSIGEDDGMIQKKEEVRESDREMERKAGRRGP